MNLTIKILAVLAVVSIVSVVPFFILLVQEDTGSFRSATYTKIIQWLAGTFAVIMGLLAIVAILST